MAGSEEAAIECERAGAVLRARVSGEIDLANVDELRSVLDAATGDASSVDFDLSGVTFMDSTGIRWVLEVEQGLRSRGGRVTIGAASPQVWHVFDVTGLVAHFGIPPTG